MALLLETTLGDLVIDLDLEGSPELCKNVLKLAKARYYTSTLVYNIDPNRFCQLGDPLGDGTGGACIYGLIAAACVLEQDDTTDFQKAITRSTQRFLKSSMGRCLTAAECREKGRVVATEMSGIPDTIGSQFLITTAEGPDMALDNYFSQSSSDKQQQGTGGENNSASGPGQRYRSLGIVSEDKNNILDKLNETYCDSGGRPYADIRIKRALIIDDPFEDPPNLDRLFQLRGVVVSTRTNDDGGDNNKENVSASPDYDCPIEEVVEKRISADQVDPIPEEENIEQLREMEEQSLQRQDKSRATVLEMLGDLPSADIKAPENVLFVCKLNSITEDEDLELIFSRFDEKVKAEIIRDPDTGSSLQYAFVEFSSQQQAVEAYFKMNNALVDDRRIKVDFSQSVAKVWDRYHQRMRMSRLPPETVGGQKKSNSGSGPSRLRDATRSSQGGRGPSGANNASHGRGGRGGRGAHDDFRQRSHNERGNFSHDNQGNGRGRDGTNGDRRWGPSIPQQNNSWQDRSQGVPERPPHGARGGHMPRPNERQREDHHHHMDKKEASTRTGHDDGSGHGRSLKNHSRSHERKRRSRSRSGSPTSEQQQRTKRNRNGSPPDHHKRRSRSRSHDRSRRRSPSRSKDRSSREHKKHHKKDRHHRRRQDGYDDKDRLKSKREREGSGKRGSDADGKHRRETEPDEHSRQRRDLDNNTKNHESRQRERTSGRRDDKPQRPVRTDKRSSSDERQHSRTDRHYDDDDDDDDEKGGERTNSKGKPNRRDRSRNHDKDSSGRGEKHHINQRRRSRSRSRD
jgi:peptidyl-prolyl cis-trans isomerase-like 4